MGVLHLHRRLGMPYQPVPSDQICVENNGWAGEHANRTLCDACGKLIVERLKDHSQDDLPVLLKPRKQRIK